LSQDQKGGFSLSSQQFFAIISAVSLHQKGFLTENSLENFRSESLFDSDRKEAFL